MTACESDNIRFMTPEAFASAEALCTKNEGLSWLYVRYQTTDNRETTLFGTAYCIDGARFSYEYIGQRPDRRQP